MLERGETSVWFRVKVKTFPNRGFEEKVRANWQCVEQPLGNRWATVTLRCPHGVDTV